MIAPVHGRRWRHSSAQGMDTQPTAVVVAARGHGVGRMHGQPLTVEVGENMDRVPVGDRTTRVGGDQATVPDGDAAHAGFLGAQPTDVASGQGFLECVLEGAVSVPGLDAGRTRKVFSIFLLGASWLLAWK